MRDNIEERQHSGVQETPIYGVKKKEIRRLKQRITELEQQLETARHEAVEQYLEGQIKSVRLSRSLQNKTPLI